MSAEKITQQVDLIRYKTSLGDTYKGYSYMNGLRESFYSDVNCLLSLYGNFVGAAKAKHRGHLVELSNMDNAITEYFQALLRVTNDESSFKLVNLGTGKISELVSFVSSLEKIPPDDKVSKASYERLLREKEDAENTAKFLVDHQGLPELHALIETSENIGIQVGEYWVLAVCSSNLIEAVVNRKLEKLGEKAEGSFRARYQELCRIITEKEDRDLQQLLPIALYEGIRNKLDHASDSNRVTPKEAKDISKMVIEFMSEVFQ